MSTTEWVVLIWLLTTLYALVGIAFRFCTALMTGEDPVDRLRPRRAMLRDAFLWPVFAMFIGLVCLGEGLSIGGLAVEYREQAQVKTRLARPPREPWEPPTDGRAA